MTMRNCLLIAQLGPITSTDATLRLELAHALERALRRIDLAVEANGGERLTQDTASRHALFSHSDPAVLAACEMLERVQGLPPVRGQRLALRIGIARLDGTSGAGEAETVLAAAAPGEAWLAADVAAELSPATRHFTRPHAVIGTQALRITRGGGGEDSGFTPYTSMTHPERMRLRHGAQTLQLDDQRPLLLIGREAGNDLVINDPRASRQHARIERRRHGFVLIDHSSNGSFIIEAGGSERHIRHGEATLVGPGRIGCGFSTRSENAEPILFASARDTT